MFPAYKLGRSAVIHYASILSRQNLMPDYQQELEDALIISVANRKDQKTKELPEEFFSKLTISNMDYINMSCS